MYSRHNSWEALAERFDAAVGTLKYWVHGSARREAEQMPAEALPVLQDLFAEILPANHSAEDIRRLVLGPVAQLEEDVRSAATASLSALIEREGKTGTARLFRQSDEGSLVEVEGEDAVSDTARVSLGAFFRIEFPLMRTGIYAVVLQHAQRSWAVVPSAVSTTPPRLRVPGLPSDTTPRFMRERRDSGLHRFVCFQAAVPFPAAIDDHLREGTSLDKRALEALGTLYESVPAARRSCHVQAVTFD